MADAAQRKARADAKRAQDRYEQAKGKLDQAGEERREGFARAKAAGLSLAEIGEVVGLHRSRVDQILKGK
jgi:DNA-directed RNA polymerase specialized sigma24 family protein